jgi:hypothetical protein
MERNEESKIIDLNFYKKVVKANKYGYEEIKKCTLNFFVKTIAEADSPSIARKILNIEDGVIDVRQSFVEESWEDLKNSFDGIWRNSNIFYQRYIDDISVSNCSFCKSSFSFFNRKHHCRSCGKIFCGSCSNKKIKVPCELISYKSYSFLSEQRVCNDCYNEIMEYNNLEEYIEFLKIGAFDIKLLWKITLLNKNWKKAVLFYVSLIRENIFRNVGGDLRDYEKKFLLINRFNFVGHSCWIVNLLKIEGLKNIIEINDENNVLPCSLTLCSDCCSRKIGLLEYLRILSGKYTDDIYEMIMKKIIEETDDLSLLLIIPYLINIIDDKYISLLMKRGEDCKIFNLIYWMLMIKCESKKRRRYEKIKNEFILNNIEISRNFNSINSLIGILEENMNNIEALKKSLGNIESKIPYIFEPNRNIERIDTNSIKISDSATKPIFVHYNIENDDRQYCLLFKKEDVRKDLYTNMIIKIFHDILTINKFEIPLITYKIIPTSKNNGFIEIVPNSKTLFDIASYGTLNNYLQLHNSDLRLKDILHNFMMSFCFWTVVTYLIGIGDRHLENIMVTTDGIIFHIDFSFILGRETKPYSPLVRIDSFMIDAIGGIARLDYFIEMCCKMFLTLRKYIYLINPLYSIYINNDPQLSDLNMNEQQLQNFIDERFLIGQKEEEVKAHFMYIIESSKDTFTQRISDYIHSYKSTIIRSENDNNNGYTNINPLSWFTSWSM